MRHINRQRRPLSVPNVMYYYRKDLLTYCLPLTWTCPSINQSSDPFIIHKWCTQWRIVHHIVYYSLRVVTNHHVAARIVQNVMALSSNEMTICPPKTLYANDVARACHWSIYCPSMILHDSSDLLFATDAFSVNQWSNVTYCLWLKLITGCPINVIICHRWIFWSRIFRYVIL